MEGECEQKNRGSKRENVGANCLLAETITERASYRLCSQLWERDILAYSTVCESVMSVVKKMKKLLNQPV